MDTKRGSEFGNWMSVVHFCEDGNGYSNSINVVNFFASMKKHFLGGAGGSVVGIATRYGMDIPGFKSWRGKRYFLFFIPFQTVPGAHTASYSMGLLDP